MVATTTVCAVHSASASGLSMLAIANVIILDTDLEPWTSSQAATKLEHGTTDLVTKTWSTLVVMRDWSGSGCVVVSMDSIVVATMSSGRCGSLVCAGDWVH